MNVCGDCDRPLPQSAKACKCGWKLPNAGPLHCPCAHETCPTPAIVKLKTTTGWANLCEPHYEAHFTAHAKRNFTALGLDRWSDESLKDWRSRVSEYTKLILKKSPTQSQEIAA